MENAQEKIQEVEKRIESAWHEIVTMEARLRTLPEQLNSFSQNLQDIQQGINNNKDQLANINTHYADYFTKVDPSTKTKLEIVTEHYASIDQYLKVAAELKKGLSDFTEFIYGNDELQKSGFKNDLEKLFEKNKNSNEELNREWSNSYRTLYMKIEGLLPGATSTGLSKAYQEQKKEYRLPVILWSAVFGLTVITMMIFGICFYKEFSDFQDSLKHILARLPFFIPAVWLAIYASKQQSQYKRLQQEYIYKETLSKSYESYKREIDQLADGEKKNELQQTLITSMIEMCGYNPSSTLEQKSHEEKLPIPGKELFNRLGWNKKASAEVEM